MAREVAAMFTKLGYRPIPNRSGKPLPFGDGQTYASNLSEWELSLIHI